MVFIMQIKTNPENRTVTDAAMLALKNGDVHEILPWIPEQHRNTVTNLFKRMLCEQRIGTDKQSISINWYLKTIRQLSSSGERITIG